MKKMAAKKKKMCIVLDEGICQDELIEDDNNNVSPCKESLNIRGDGSPQKPMVLANSSSDEDDAEPVVKKKRATRRPRRQAAEQPTTNDDLKEKASIFKTTVNACYKKIESGLHGNERLSSSDDEDMNNNDNNNNNDEPRKTRKSPRKTCPLLLSPISPVVDVDDHVMTSPVTRDRSPSPPPLPVDTWVPGGRRGPRRTKAVKQALAEIQAMKRTMPAREVFHNLSLGDSSFDASMLENDNEIVVKIRSRFGIDRFSMKPNETFLSVFEKMAAKENVPVDRCLMFRDDDNIEPYMTPASAKITVADIIGFCARADEAEVDEEENESGEDSARIKLQVQAKGLRHKAKFSILRTEPLLKLMLDFAKQQSCDVQSVRFYFDGELVSPGSTPQDYDMEDEECLDAVFTTSS